MKIFAIYHSSTGQIIQICQAQDEYAAKTSMPEGGGLLEVAGLFDNSLFCVVSGVLQAMPKQPSPHHTFNWTTKQWQDLRTLQDLRAAKWAEIKQARSVAEYGGFTWDTSTFDSDAISQARIQGAVQLAGMSADFAIDWTLADNAARTLSAANMLAVGAALGLHVASQFAKARGLRAQVEAAASAAELTLIGW